MSLSINNDFIQKMYSAANEALKSADLDKEASVIHSDEQGTTISGHKWVTLGGRSRDFKAANKRTREMFFENITRLFGGKSQLPSEVLKEFKMEDFKLDGFDNVKSERPLTARRIIAICKKANESIKTTINKKLAELKDNVHEYAGCYDELSELEQNEYRAKIREKIEENPRLDVRKLCAKYPPREFVTDKICNMLGKLNDCEGMDDLRCGVSNLRNAGAFKNVTLDVLMSVLSMLNDCLELDANALKRVNDNCANRSPAEKVFLFNKFVADFVSKNLKKLGIENNCFSSNTVVNKCLTFEEFAGTFNFNVQISEDDLKKNDPQTVYRFMRACVDQHKTEYSQQDGGKNSQLGGDANELNEKSKYENIVETIKQSQKLVDNNLADKLDLAEKKTKIFKKWYEGNSVFRNWVRNSGGNYDAELSISEELMEEYRKEIQSDYPEEDDTIVAEFKFFLRAKYHVDKTNAKIAKEGEQLPPFPLAVTKDGNVIAKELANITGVGSHEYSNTVDQFQLANKVFSNIHTTFMECLEKDAKKGNTVYFDTLMDAMNMPGCLQFRTDPILTLKAELELGVDLSVNTVSTHEDVVKGFGNKINEMRKNLIATGEIKEDDAIQYSVVVDRYIESVGNGTEIKLGDELKNKIKDDNNVRNFFEESNQMDDLMKKGSVKVSKEFFNLSPVKKYFLAWFDGYVEAEGKEVGK